LSLELDGNLPIDWFCSPHYAIEKAENRIGRKE
jgi:hypothetical protein